MKLVHALLILLLFGSLSMGFLGCGGQEEQKPPAGTPQEQHPAQALPPVSETPTVLVGVVFPMTGDVQTYGRECERGLRLAIDEENGLSANLRMGLQWRSGLPFSSVIMPEMTARLGGNTRIRNCQSRIS